MLDAGCCKARDLRKSLEEEARIAIFRARVQVNDSVVIRIIHKLAHTSPWVARVVDWVVRLTTHIVDSPRLPRVVLRLALLGSLVIIFLLILSLGASIFMLSFALAVCLAMVAFFALGTWRIVQLSRRTPTLGEARN